MFAALKTAAEWRLDNFNPQELVNTAWAAAAARRIGNFNQQEHGRLEC